MECTSLSSIFSLFWKNYLSVEFPNFDIDAEVKERDKEPNLLVLSSAWNLYANPSILGSMVAMVLKVFYPTCQVLCVDVRIEELYYLSMAVGCLLGRQAEINLNLKLRI